MEWIDILKLLAAIAAGALIGLDRELADKPAGFRTNILICLGAALFTVLSAQLADSTADRTRISAQIVTGVGFLGAGAIIQFRGNVIGLTTAATIWTVASVGMAFGGGQFALGALGTILTAAVLFGLAFVERRIDDWRSVAHFEIELERGLHGSELVERLAQENSVRLNWVVDKTVHGLAGTLTAMGRAPQVRAFERALLDADAVRSLKRR